MSQVDDLNAALDQVDTATTAAGTAVAAVGTRITALLAQIAAAPTPQQLTDLTAKANAEVAKLTPIVDSLNGMAADVSNPVPVPVPAPTGGGTGGVNV